MNDKLIIGCLLYTSTECRKRFTDKTLQGVPAYRSEIPAHAAQKVADTI